MNNIREQPRFCAAIARAAFLGGVCLTVVDLSAQEALNESFEVDRGRRARKQAIDRNLYNLKAGPVLMRFDALMGFEFNDNPNLEDDPDDVDFAFRPQIDMAALWALDARNALSFNLGVGYVKYVNNTELDHLIIAPSSELALDIYTGDFTINLHERVSHSQNPVSDPTVSGTGDFGGIDNTVGLRVDWDLNRLTASAGYDHYNFISTSSGVGETLRRGTNAPGGNIDDVQDRSSEMFYGRVGVRLNPAITTGVEASGELTSYESEFFHDNTQFSVGAFADVQVTRDVKGRIAGGYVHSEFDPTRMASAPPSVDDFYAELSVEQQLNQDLSHRLAVGREARAGAASEFVTMWYARYENNWSMSQWSTLHTTLFYENGRERTGAEERFERVGAGAGVSVPLSRKLTAGAGYQLLHKNSDQENRDYLQNSVTLEFRYAF
jgi:hypothetical protein